MNLFEDTPREDTRLAAVTGAGGFIASHLVETLLERGRSVRAFVHYNALHSLGHLQEVIDTGRAARAEWFMEDRLQVYAGDLLDAGQVAGFVKHADVVMHLAALIGIPYSYRAPQSYLSVNVQGTMNVLEACRRAGVARVIHTSTSEVLGTAEYVPQDEKHPLRTQSPYAASKLAADKFAESYYHSFDLPVVTLRPFNTYGPRQSLRAILPTILAQAMRPDVEAVELGSLDPRRDFTYVSDTVEAYLCAAIAPAKCAGRVYHLGTGATITIAELAERALAVVGIDKPVKTLDKRRRPEASEVMALQSDNARAKAELGWTPKVGLEEGVERTAEWLRPRLERIDVENYII